MSNEAKWVYGTQTTLEGSGASVASQAYYLASSKAPLSSADHLDYPYGTFVLTCAFAAAVAAAVQVDLYQCDQNIDGTSDAPTVAAGYQMRYIGSFPLPSGTSASGTYPLSGRLAPLSKEANYYIMNNTAQTLSAAWTLKVTPCTMGPVA